jgi:hypothetical protein
VLGRGIPFSNSGDRSGWCAQGARKCGLRGEKEVRSLRVLGRAVSECTRTAGLPGDQQSAVSKKIAKIDRFLIALTASILGAQWAAAHNCARLFYNGDDGALCSGRCLATPECHSERSHGRCRLREN